VKSEIAYWTRPGRKNTEETIRLALKRAQQLRTKNFVVASCSGWTTRKLLDTGARINIVSVTHEAGFYKPGLCEMNKKTAEFLKKRNVAVLTATHFLGGFDRAIRFTFGGVAPAELAANTLRIFGQGIKVCIEVAIMALDAGLIPYNKEIIAIGGTSSGADTAIVCLPKHGKDFFSFDVREIICKPRERK
jgi:hypothetical protein